MSHDIYKPKATWGLRLFALILLGISVATAAFGITGRIRHEKQLQEKTEQQDIIPVAVIAPKQGPEQQSLVLPGNVTAYIQAPIYARVNGYLKSWNTDIGAKVKAGQVLGIIETPELDQQIHKAEADLTMAEANYELANSTADRWQNLLLTDSVSHQETDEKTGDAKAKLSIVNALKANLNSLQAQQAFNRVVAPFNGVVTDRKTDIGMLITAGSSSSSSPLFHVAQIDKLRIYVEVPQNFAPMIKPGLKAELHFPEHPSRVFSAKLINTSNALNEDSRTLKVELQMDNLDNEILPGTYVEVHFTLPTRADVYRLPSSALLFRKHGMEVATVAPDHRVVLKPITIGRDLGTVVEVVAGLDARDQVIDSPSDSLAQGDKVSIVDDEAKQDPQPSQSKP